MDQIGMDQIELIGPIRRAIESIIYTAWWDGFRHGVFATLLGCWVFFRNKR